MKKKTHHKHKNPRSQKKSLTKNIKWRMEIFFFCMFSQKTDVEGFISIMPKARCLSGCPVYVSAPACSLLLAT